MRYGDRLHKDAETRLRADLDSVALGVVDEENALAVMPLRYVGSLHALIADRLLSSLDVVDLEGPVVRRRRRARPRARSGAPSCRWGAAASMMCWASTCAWNLLHTEHVLPEPQRSVLVLHAVGQVIHCFEPNGVRGQRHMHSPNRIWLATASEPMITGRTACLTPGLRARRKCLRIPRVAIFMR